MEISVSILSIVIALSLGTISPGPSFLMVARTALAGSRKDGLAAAVGMGVGGVLFALVALLGLLAILAIVPWLHLGLRVLGGAYLVYLGYRIWHSAQRPLVVEDTSMQSFASKPWRSFFLGLTTQVSNPKTAIVYASVFASALPGEVPSYVFVALPMIVFAIETCWYSVVALALSYPAPRARYLAWKAGVDRAAGVLMSVLGIKLVFEAPQL